jgi:hypothetical protein
MNIREVWPCRQFLATADLSTDPMGSEWQFTCLEVSHPSASLVDVGSLGDVCTPVNIDNRKIYPTCTRSLELHRSLNHASARLQSQTITLPSMVYLGYVKLRLLSIQSVHLTSMMQNEDCGQMSAWYLFSALGFYPVNPVLGLYVVGS